MPKPQLTVVGKGEPAQHEASVAFLETALKAMAESAKAGEPIWLLANCEVFCLGDQLEASAKAEEMARVVKLEALGLIE